MLNGKCHSGDSSSPWLSSAFCLDSSPCCLPKTVLCSARFFLKVRETFIGLAGIWEEATCCHLLPIHQRQEVIDRQTVKGCPGHWAGEPIIKLLLRESMDTFRRWDPAVPAYWHLLDPKDSSFINASELLQVSFGLEKPWV